MACFTVSVVEAVVVTAVQKHLEKKEKLAHAEHLELPSELTENTDNRISRSTKLKWLSMMLWGGSALLAFEHLWHGEITPWFPFLTAMSDAADRAEMFREIATVGVCMALLTTAIWFGICKAADIIVNRKAASESITRA
ncbi:MAG: hypothetical protein IJ058_05905 [Lachnospiraceae bacterium]|nr:hypothetical protein [Lachnospiraceae bacterium]